MNLKGENFILRQIGEEDYDLLTLWNFDPEITRYFSPRPEFNPDSQKRWFKKLLGDVTKLKFMILPFNLDTPIGVVSLQNIDHDNRRAEIGITIGDNQWKGKGFGRRSVKCLMNYAFYELELHQINAEVFSKNLSALKLFQDCGFRKDGIKRDYWLKQDTFFDVVFLSILKSEFLVNE
jgi:RimJ/RimL family protein N-acetyltransferase